MQTSGMSLRSLNFTTFLMTIWETHCCHFICIGCQ
uniref:Uncharacterized protein n=1 Tax=Arundo donax TaxID=35708 RepID=A0A0A9AK67_ARUDO